MFRTKFGRDIYAIGGWEPVAAASGVPVGRYTVLASVLGGLLCGLASVVITGQVGAGTLTIDSLQARAREVAHDHPVSPTEGRRRRSLHQAAGSASCVVTSRLWITSQSPYATKSARAVSTRRTSALARGRHDAMTTAC